MRGRAAAAGLALLLALGAAALGGCSGLGYYAQALEGHAAMLRAARPVDQWLADPATPPSLRERLRTSQRIRAFAVRELHEPDNASYRRYADLGRRAAVWNVVAAPATSLELHTWCFAVVGCVGYRGYYDRAAAEAFAAPLAAQGLDTRVYGVPAYSTLGKLPFERAADPLLNTFIDTADAELARMMFHELAHQIVYAPGDTEFNELFATAVERIGTRRWLAAEGSDAERAAHAAAQARQRDFEALTRACRDRLARLYASDASEAEKLAGKAAALADLRADHARIKRERWGGYTGYDAWIASANNASLGVLAAYDGMAPAFERLFEREGADFPRFYAEVARLAALPPAARRAALP